MTFYMLMVGLVLCVKQLETGIDAQRCITLITSNTGAGTLVGLVATVHTISSLI
jgi:hypothetical protein